MVFARVAQLVEHDLAKVGAAGSSPVSRSHRNTKKVSMWIPFFCVLRAQSGLEDSSDLGIARVTRAPKGQTLPSRGESAFNTGSRVP